MDTMAISGVRVLPVAHSTCLEWLWIVIPLAGLVAVIAWLIVSGEPDVEHTGIPGWFGRSASSLRRLSSLAQKFERTYGMAVDPETQLRHVRLDRSDDVGRACRDRPGRRGGGLRALLRQTNGLHCLLATSVCETRALTLATGRRETSP